MTQPIIWVHEDALRQSHPVFSAAKNSKAAIFIWDNTYFQAQGYTTKRLLFIYECLLEIDVTIIVGDTVKTLSDLSDDVVYMAFTPNPDFKAVAEVLRVKSINVEVVEDEPLSQIPFDTDMGRFFRFWNKGRKSMMKTNAGL